MHEHFGWMDALILGFIQGLTEFLPISSSAHLRIIGPLLPGGADPGAAFTAITQLGTELAVFIYFRHDIANMLRAWWASVQKRGLRHLDATTQAHARLAWLVIIGTLPICVFGLLLRDFIEGAFRTLWVTAAMLIIFAFIMAWAEKHGRQNRGLHQLKISDGIYLGLAQSLALIPGVSRSGGTISAGLLLGLNKESAARFSFLLAIPAVLISGVYMLLFKREPMTSDQWLMTGAATLVAFIVGYGVIVWFMRLISSRGFMPFVIYRVVLGILIFVGLTIGVLTP